MIIIDKTNRGELYERCSSIEIRSLQPKSVQVISIDGHVLNEVHYTEEGELREAVIAAILNVYLKDEVIISNELCRLFESTELQLKSADVNYSGHMIMYSDMIVGGLIKAGYRNGLKKESIEFFE